ncbi:MAG TPA: phospholipase D-like domain-containing protein [Anaerolineales bacterium]|nr:phospholipase D-like domain-containing protein [Anaerolineales bacterium]
MDDFKNQDCKNGFSMKVWRGERMCLIGFDVDAPEDDLVGFAIECCEPGSTEFYPLLNRLAFSYDAPVDRAVTGDRKFSSVANPFQKFRWLHFPYNPQNGVYTYRGTKMHMPTDNPPVRGTSIDLPISLDPVTYENFLDVGFTRNFASSQAFAEMLQKDPTLANVIPDDPDDGLNFKRLGENAYQWLGFEAYELIFDFLQEVVNDPSIQLDVLAYDLNEGKFFDMLKQIGPRLRILIDDSEKTDKKGTVSGHGVPTSAESKAAAGLPAGSQVRRMHFMNLQHNKVLIAKRDGKCFKVLTGSTNFSYRGIYIQANNVLVFNSPEIAQLYGDYFEAAFQDYQNPKVIRKDPLTMDWHTPSTSLNLPVEICFSPHSDPDVSLGKVKAAIDAAVSPNSSVLYSVAFLNLITSGKTKEAFDSLMTRPVFSYGVVDTLGKLEVHKPDGSVGQVDFNYLSDHAPEPFKSEWSGGKGINVHHKFVVTDFNLPTAQVFTGSSNLAPGGEKNNGDNLISIKDQRVATSYALEALRIFDHLHFRSTMKQAFDNKDKAMTMKALTLAKPTAISHEKAAWFEEYYVADSQKERDRKLFSH